MAQGVPDRLRPRIFLKFRHYKGGRSSAKRNGRLYPGKNPWYSLSEADIISKEENFAFCWFIVCELTSRARL